MNSCHKNEKQKRIEWVATLKVGDEVAMYGGGWARGYYIHTIVKITPSGRLNLSSGSIVNPDGTIRGTYSDCIYPVTEEVKQSIWRRNAVAKIRRDLEIDKLSDNNLNRILQIIKEHKEEKNGRQ